MLSIQINKTIYKALRLITESQDKHGRFIDSQSIFVNSIILRCLNSVFHFTETKNICERGINFLLKNKSKNWSWNYWLENSNRQNISPRNIPNDLDDTFSALSAISLYRNLSGEAFAHITNNLIICETETGGPYNTWLISPDKNGMPFSDIWLDIDIVVNSNVAYFLKLHNVHMPQLIEYTEKTIKDASVNGKYESKYYDDLAILYFISKWYGGSLVKEIEKQTLKLRNSNGSWGNQLRDALAISILVKVNTEPEIYIDAVKNLTEKYENFEALPFYIESISANKPKYAGSATLTASLCAEALALFEQKYLLNDSDENEKTTEHKINEQIVSKVKTTLEPLPLKTKTIVYRLIDKLKDNYQITLMPYFFAKNADKQSLNTFIELGTANLYGWLAYTIYDRISDNDFPTENYIELLPVANICLINCLDIYNVVNKGNINSISRELIFNMEKANIWEKENCRFDPQTKISLADIPIYKNYQTLSYKSLPHALPILSIIQSENYSKERCSKVISFFEHYLVAKQLNDDAHDWLTDIDKGLINSVGSLVLQDYFKNKYTSTVNIHDKETRDNLTRIFNYKILDSISMKILLETSKALEVINNMPIEWNRDYLYEMLKPLEKSAVRAVTERDSINEFLRVYQKKSAEK